MNVREEGGLYNRRVLENSSGQLCIGLTYTIGDLLAVGARYAPAVLYPLFLTPSEYGIYAIATAITTVMGFLVVFGLKGAAFKQSFDYDDSEARKSFYGSLWLFIAIAGAVFVLASGWLWSSLVPNLLESVRFDPYIRLAFWAAYLNSFGIVIYEILRAQSKAAAYVTLSIAHAFTLVFLAFFLVTNLQDRLIGALLAPVITGLIWAILYTLVLFPHIKLRFDAGKVRRALAYGLPLIPHQLGHWMLNLSDRLILEPRVPIADLGAYGFGYNIGNVEQVIANAGNSALMPSYGKAGRDNTKLKGLPDLFTRYVAWAAAGALALSIFSDEFILGLMPAGFAAAANIVPWVALGFFCVALYYGPMNIITLLAGETRWVWLFTLVAGSVNILANLLLVPMFGIQAAAINTLLGYFTLFALVYWYSRRFDAPAYPWKHIAAICALLVTGIALDRLLIFSATWVELTVDLGIMIVYGTIFLIPQLKNSAKLKPEPSSSRIKIGELTPSRVYAAAARRVADLPHLVNWQFSTSASQNRARLNLFRDLNKGEQCVILANGPSLSRMDLGQLKQQKTIGMNRIYLNFQAMGFQTTYHIAINELVLQQFGSEIASLTMPKFINWNCRGLLPKEKMPHYLRFSLGLSDKFESDITRQLSSGGTVTFAALQLAYFMGFARVILVGLDHRFATAGTPNQVQARDETKDESHFHPAYFPPGSRWQLPDLHRSELAYALARQAFEADGRQILDATIDGACPVFEKAEFSSLF